MMKKFTFKMLAIAAFLFVGSTMVAQNALTMEPAEATVFDEITLTLDVSLTCPDSALFNVDSVMMHSGVTIGEDGWQNVVEFDALGANGEAPKLVFIGMKNPAAISVSPAGAGAFDEITLTIDTRLSCPDSALFGVDSVMMHSGVKIGEDGWQNVVEFNGMGANGQAPKLTHNGDSTWSITYIPAEFYGLEAGTEVAAINCVFNNGSWDLEGKDFTEEGECTDFTVPMGATDMYKWAITFIPADFYGIEAGTAVSAINCVFNNGSWDLEGKDFTEEGECTDFSVALTPVGIGESNEVAAFDLYPNPVDGELYIKNLKEVNKIEVFSVTGAKVKSLDDVTTSKVTINTSDLQSGLYFVTVHSNNKVKTAKFVKN